jgi:hypothetical protein
VKSEITQLFVVSKFSLGRIEKYIMLWLCILELIRSSIIKLQKNRSLNLKLWRAGRDLNVHRLGDSACGDNIIRKIPFFLPNFGQDVVTLSVLMRNNS